MKNNIKTKNKSYNWPLRLFITVVPFFLAMLFVCFFFTSHTMIKKGEGQIQYLSRVNTENLDNWLNSLESQLQIYKENIEFHCDDPASYRDYILPSYKKNADFPEGVYIGGKNGDYFLASGEEAHPKPLVRASTFYTLGAYSDDFIFSGPLTDPITQKPHVIASARLRSKGLDAESLDQSYVIAANISLDYPDQLIYNLSKEDLVDRAMLISGRDVRVLADSYTRKSGNKLSADERLTALAEAIEADKTGFMKVTSEDGSDCYITITALTNADWFLLLYTKKSSLTSPVYGSYLWISLIALGLLIGLFMVILLVTGIMRGVQSQSTKSQKINEAIAKSFISVAYIDKDNSHFEEVWFQSQIRDLVGRQGRALSALNKIIHTLSTETFIPRLEKFIDLVTLDDRIFNKQSISVEFYSRTYGWCRASFIPVNTDEYGRLHSVLFAIQKQEGEILELRDKLRVEDTLLECVQTLSSYENVDDAIYHLLGIIADFHKADRAYIFRIDYNQDIMCNTHEWCSMNIPSVIASLQNVPIQYLERWINLFQKNGYVQINDVSSELASDTMEYKLLSAQNIRNLYAVPFLSADGTVIGFLGIANPTGNAETDVLLKSVSSFIQEELLKKQYTDELYNLSYTDKMTQTLNRHAYNRDMEELNRTKATNVGVVFADVNGLKVMNDEHGHEHGDLLIRQAADLLRDTFHESTDTIYRIGGDEFVVFSRDIRESAFKSMVNGLINQMGEIPIMSIGEAWISSCDNLESQIKVADENMYQRKSLYYALTGKNRRKS